MAVASDVTTRASSVYNSDYLPECAVDGDRSTRWASRAPATGPEWLEIQFDQPVSLSALRIVWEAAYAREYQVQVSATGREWWTVSRNRDGRGGEELVQFPAVTGRFVRIVGERTGPHPLYSIWEVEFPDPEVAARWSAMRAAGESRWGEQARAALRAAGIEEVVFAVRELGPDGHWYANFSYYAEGPHRVCYRAGGRLGCWKVLDGSVRWLLEDPQGTIRDPAVHYDGESIVFAWRRSGTPSFHLYEICADGSGLRQITDGGGNYDDIEPAWLPDDRIVFISSRCRRWVNCWLTQVGTIHRCNRDGSDVRMLSANIEHDNTPWPLPDGRVLYTRWEYVDRSQVHYHHLWAMNPDGTAQQVVFGNYHPGGVFIDAKPIPASDRIVLIHSPGHGQREHAGYIEVLDPKAGPDDLTRMRRWTRTADFRDPWAINSEWVLAARGRALVAVHSSGRVVTLWRFDGEPRAAEIHEPRPRVVRPRERQIPDRVNWARATGELILSDIYEGRNMVGVQRGEIARLLILETLPKPINYTGGMEPLSYGGTFTLERIIGTVPVEDDGSARFELPALRAFTFVALDHNGWPVKRMQSFTSVMPGEVAGCVGCHEPRTAAAPNRTDRPMPRALQRPPSRVEPVSGVPDVFDFPRDIQPILDALCVRCHGYEQSSEGGPYAARLILSGDRGPMYSHSYYMLTIARLFSDGRNDPKSNYPPRTLGSVASRIFRFLDGSHHGVRAAPEQVRALQYWIDTGAPYPGTYAALGSGMIGGYAENRQVMTDDDWPTTKAAAEVIERRCMACHREPARLLPRSLSDERGVSFWRPDWSDPRLLTSRHIVFNLSRPEKSLMLLAPLSRDAGGWQLCKVEGGGPVFASTTDPDYQAILRMIEAGKEVLNRIGRFDMPHFRAPAPYLREIRRYGVLPPEVGDDQTPSPYELDRRYWDLWTYRPGP